MKSSALLLIGVFCLANFEVRGEPSVLHGGGGGFQQQQGSPIDSSSNEEVDPTKDDLASVLINTVYTSATPLAGGSKGSGSGQGGLENIPEIEMKKLKAATKGAGLSEEKADRVMRAVRALDLKYNDVVDLKKVMMNPATSADYADRVRRALEDALVDKHQKASAPNKTVPSMAEVDSKGANAFGRQVSAPPQNQQVIVGVPSPFFPALSPFKFAPSPPQLFFGTPLNAQALPEDLENLLLVASPVLPRKEAFQIAQLAYLAKLSRAEVFDLQHEFTSGLMTPIKATVLIQQLTARLPHQSLVAPNNVAPQAPIDSKNLSPDLSKPLDPATLQRLKTVAELSGVDKSTSARLVRAVMNSGLEPEQVHQIGDVIQHNAASPEDLTKFIDHLEETDLHSWRKQARAAAAAEDDSDLSPVESDFVPTPEQAKGADWLFADNQQQY